MKKKSIFILTLIIASCSICKASDVNTECAEQSYANGFGLKMFLLLEGDIENISECLVVTKIVDEDKVYKVYDALNDARYLCRSYDSFIPDPNQKAICFVDKNNKGFMFPIDWSEEEKRVTFAGGYSEGFYKVLNEYGVIATANSPDVILFSSDQELSEIKFVPMPQYAGCNGNLKKIVFFEANKFDFEFNRTENWKVLAETTDPNEFNKIKHAFSTADYCLMHILEGLPLVETAIVFIYDDGNQELFIIHPNKKKKVVEFEGGYSRELYEILISYGIIKPD
jgi:hypothetical protein